jgi:MYXO-CTERM domain-containing protein
LGIASLTLITLGSVIVVSDVDAGWRRPHADAQASNRVLDPGQLSGDLDHHPGFSEIVELERPKLPATTLHDVTDDGVPELLLPYRGRVAALDMTQGGFVWQSGMASVDSIVDFADFDGDGTLELLAASRRVGGGLLTLDPTTGAILARTTPLPNRSGIDAQELAIADVDQDGDDDVVYPAGFYGLKQLWIDGLGPDAEQWSASFTYVGYSNITPMRVGRFAPGGSPSVILDQGPAQQWFELCPGKTPGAVCGTSLSCWCPAAVFTGVHPGQYAFGEVFVVDVEGDGVDEIVTVADDPRHTRSVSVFSPAQARAAGQGAAGQLWYRDYSEGATVPVTPRVAPVDFDQDGGIEQLVSFVDNLDADSDLAGQPIDDGIDHEGLSVAVFDASTGQVDATFEDAFAHGWLDLDGDSRPEIVVSAVQGYKWQPGLRAYEFGCADGCLEEAWSVPHSFAPTLVRESFDRQNIPTPTLLTLRVDDRDALLAYQDGALYLLRMVDGQLESTATRLLAPEQVVIDVADGFAVLSDGRTLQLVDAQLASVGPVIPIPVQGTESWTTARLDGFDAPIYEAKLYDAPLPAAGSFAEPKLLLPHVALAENLDGQGNDEIIDFRLPEDELGPGFELRALAWNQGQLEPRWSIVGDDEPALAGLELPSPMQFGTGNFGGGDGGGENQGAQDLVFTATDAVRDTHLVTVDGDSGAILHVQATTTPSATFTPLLVGDLASLDGSPQPDGIDDVLIDGLNYFELIVLGHDSPVWTQPTGFYHAVGAQADLDGDGLRELISTTSNTLENPGQALDINGFGVQSQWGPAQLGLPTGRTQVLSFAHVDGDAGLDMLYITGEGALELRNGASGAMLPGAPVYLAHGDRSSEPYVDAASLGALMVIDVDNDGHDEAIVGGDDGWVYAINIADMDGSLEWSLQVGAPVSQLAAGDVDDDGFQELLVATEAGQGIVLDSLGVVLEILAPGNSCLEHNKVEVSGKAHGIVFVDVLLNGELVNTVAVEGSSWATQIWLSGPGEYELRAEGRDEHGELVAISTTAIMFGGDEDGDGVTVCGGDCDDLDPATAPGQTEICGDGIDQDCDGEDRRCDDDGGRFPDQEEWDPRGRCNCSSEGEQRGGGGFAPLGVVIVLAWRRRRAAPNSSSRSA